MNCSEWQWVNGARYVSIHIRHCWRMNFYVVFTQQLTTRCFNPHSPLLANELIQPTSSEWQWVFQSTFAIAGEWIYQIGSSPRWLTSFNPHSPLLANELVLVGQLVVAAYLVSIHIRHCWRMNYGKYANQPSEIHAFQSTFAIAGEWIHCHHGVMSLMSGFQSTFAIAGEWIAMVKQRTDIYSAVSIHIRHCWRMNFMVPPSKL